MIHRRAWMLRAASCLAVALSTVGAVQAEDNWPSRPVRIIVPYAPGGAADTLGRLIAHQLELAFKQSFVVENRAGGGATIGSQVVARAEPDGYVLEVSGVGSHVVAPFRMPERPYDALKDFTHIALLGGPPAVLVVNPSLPIKDNASFADYVKRQPKGVAWGSPGEYASLIGEAYRQATGLNLVQILYKGANPAVADVVGNQVPSAFLTMAGASVAQIRAGRLRPLAISATERLPEFPDVPTFKELGYPQLTGMTWFALSGPAGMPASVVDKLNQAVRRALQSPDGKAELDRQNMLTYDWDAAAFTRFVQDELTHWGPYIQATSEKK